MDALPIAKKTQRKQFGNHVLIFSKQQYFLTSIAVDVELQLSMTHGWLLSINFRVMIMIKARE